MLQVPLTDREVNLTGELADAADREGERYGCSLYGQADGGLATQTLARHEQERELPRERRLLVSQLLIRVVLRVKPLH